jgi:hypothetical protein
MCRRREPPAADPHDIPHRASTRPDRRRRAHRPLPPHIGRRSRHPGRARGAASGKSAHSPAGIHVRGAKAAPPRCCRRPSTLRSSPACNYPHLSTSDQCFAGLLKVVFPCAELFEGPPLRVTLSGPNIDRSRSYNGPCGYEGQKSGHAGWYRPLGNPQIQHFQGFRTADPSSMRKFARTFAPRTSPQGRVSLCRAV